MNLNRLLFFSALFLLFAGVAVAQPPSLPGAPAPLQEKITLSLRAGWNLVKLPESQLADSSPGACRASDLVSSYAFDFRSGNYVQAGTQQFASLLQDNEVYAKHTAYWIEVNRNCTVVVDGSFRSEDMGPVTRGWNFVSVSPDMRGKTLQEIKGTCQLRDAYFFDAANQQWKPLGLNERIGNIVGSGVVLYADQACDLVGVAMPNTGQLVVNVTDINNEPVAEARVAFTYPKDLPPDARNVFLIKDLYTTINRFTTLYGSVEGVFSADKEVTFNVNKRGYKEFKSKPVKIKLDTTEYFNVVLEKEAPGKVFSGDPYRGSESAPVVLKTYENFLDPASGALQEVLAQLQSVYGDLIKIVYKDFPLFKKDVIQQQFNVDFLNRNAVRAAMAAHCANEQGKFWPYHDLVFKKQTSTKSVENFIQYGAERGSAQGTFTETVANFTDTDLESFATELSLDTQQFRECMQSERYKGAVTASVKEGFSGLTFSKSTDIRETPTVSIEGVQISGVEYFYVYKTLIDGLLYERYYQGSPVKGAAFYLDREQKENHPDYPLRTQPVVTILEFCDFESVECRNLQPLLNQVISEFESQCIGTEIKTLGRGAIRCQNNIRRIHKDFPLDIHLWAKQAANAVRCSQDLQVYWDFHDRLYLKQPDFGPNTYRQVWREISPPSSVDNENRLMQCISQNKYYPLIEKDIQHGKDLGVTTVPTLFVNGTKVEGLPSYEELKSLIQQKLDTKLTQPVSQTGGALATYCQAYPLAHVCRSGSEARIIQGSGYWT